MSEAESRKLELRALHERHSGLTPALSGALYEAASVCLDRHHQSPVEFEVHRNEDTTKRAADFEKPNATALNAWANTIDTTEAGAYCVCLAAVEVEEQLVAVRRADTLTGADWYVAPVGASLDDLEDCLRLEVSGLDSGNRTAIKSRLLDKVAQTRKGDSNLPALASVVGFKEKHVAIQRVQDNNP